MKPQPSNPRAHIRQGIYLNALRTLNRLSIHKGSFSKHEVPMYLAPPPDEGEKDGMVYRMDGGPERAWVYKLEEKGSDVNLATYLLRDAFKDLYEVAVVVSDDSDLLEPVKLVQKELGKKVIVARVPRYSGRGGKKAERASVFQGKVEFIRDVRKAHLADNQLPVEITTREGKLVKRPPEWGPTPERLAQQERGAEEREGNSD